VLWVGALQLMLDKGKELDWFASPQIVGFAVVAVVGFAFFVAWELTEKHPVVDLSLFRRRNFWSGALTTAVAYGVFFGNVVLLPLWLQQFMGYTATQAGMVLAPVGLLAIVLSPVVGVTMNRVDPRVYVTVSFVVFFLVLWMRSQFTVETDFVTIMIPTLIQGIGMAGFFIPLVTITLSGLHPSRIPAAAGLSNFTRITAGAFGVSIATTAWEDRATLHHAQLAESINSGRPVVEQTLQQMQAMGLGHQQSLGLIDRLLTQQAFMISTQEIFYLSALLFLALIPLVWIARRMHGPASAEASGAH
jgi:DHA2 family multidrug resistance protein